MTILRRVHVVLTIGALIVVGAISLSDRLVPAASRAFSVRAGRATDLAATATDDALGPEATSGLGVLSDLPIGWDTVTHVMLWMGVGTMAAGLIRRFLHIPAMWLALVALSGAVEVAQRQWTDGRQFEVIDLIANAVGAAIGLGFGLAILLMEIGAATVFRWLKARRVTPVG